jgi:DNA mismatch repair protein MutH
MEAIFKGRTKLGPGMKKVTDWVGKRVETLVDMENGWATAKAGTIAEVTYARSGLTLKTEPCSFCGLGLRITRVRASDVRLVA